MGGDQTPSGATDPTASDAELIRDEVIGDEVIGNEFAEVSVRVDHQGRSPRLLLTDRRTGRSRFLDALELETIIWLPDGHMQQLLDPSADRWRDT